jgi:hypothetical protein
MAKFRATLPKEKPDSGKAHIVVAYKNEAGDRVEFVGQILDIDADKIMREVIMLARPTATEQKD